MNPKRMKRIMRAEIAKLRRAEIIDDKTQTSLLAEYPLERWDYSSLSRWFLIFGAIATAGGLLVLGTELLALTLQNLAILLAVLVSGCFYAGSRLGIRTLIWAKRSVELLGSLCIIGLTFTLGMIYSSGSGNWPALLLIDLLILLPLAYLLRNVLLLILVTVVFFTWFGGVTGYISGWGAYWFGMNYPMRFLVAGSLMAGISLLHRKAERNRLQSYAGFFKVWLSGGVFFSEMSLWLMSLFGNYGTIFGGHFGRAGELLVFNILWAGLNFALLRIGTLHGVRMLRGYAVTYLIIQAYTLYFWKVAGHLGPVLGSFVAGAVTLGLILYAESRRRAARANQT